MNALLGQNPDDASALLRSETDGLLSIGSTLGEAVPAAQVAAVLEQDFQLVEFPRVQICGCSL